MSARAGLTLLSRPGCELCEAFEETMRAALGTRCPPLAVVDIDERPDLRIRYGRLIPVLLDAEGRLVCQTEFDAGAVEAWLASARAAPPV